MICGRITCTLLTIAITIIFAFWGSKVIKVPFKCSIKRTKIVKSYNLGVSLELLCCVEICSWTSNSVKPAQWRVCWHWPLFMPPTGDGDTSVRHFITSMLEFVLKLHLSNYSEVKTRTNIILTNFELWPCIWPQLLCFQIDSSAHHSNSSRQTFVKKHYARSPIFKYSWSVHQWKN